MRNLPCDHSRWYFLPPEPRQPGFRRSGIFIIVVLAFLTLGVLVIGFVHAPLPSMANHGGPQHVHQSSHRRSL